MSDGFPSWKIYFGVFELFIRILYTFDTPNLFLPDKFNLFEVFSFLFTITLILLSWFAATHEVILRYKMQ